MKKIILMTVMAVLCLNFWARGQSPSPIFGIITDQKGNPIQDATIQLSAHPIVTKSQQNGTFKILLPTESGTLIISHIGFETERITFNKSTSINLSIMLKTEDNSLDEVQVIGYGATTRKLNTGSSSSITAKDIAKQPVQNLLSALSGRMSGVVVQTTNGLPGGGISVKVRGKGSILAGTDPLYIVDGIPYNTTIGTLNTTVNVLATQALNGSTNPLNSFNPDDIENITVLKDADATSIYGSRGTNGVVLITTKKGTSGKTKYNVNLNRSSSRATSLAKMLSLDEYLNLRKEAYANDGLIPSADPSSPNYAPDLLLWSQTEGKDWVDYLFGGTANATSMQASVSGGNAQTKFLVGTNFRSENSVLPGDNRYQRGGLQANFTHQSLDERFRLQFSNTIALDNNNTTNGSALSTAMLLPPNYPLYEANGSFNYYYVNPLARLSAYSIAKTFNLNTNMSLDYEITKGLRFKTNAGLSRISLDQTQVFPTVSLGPESNNYTNFGKNMNRSLIVEPQINYQRAIKDINITALLGATYQNTLSEGDYLKGENYSGESLMENIGSAGTITASNSTNEYRYASLFARFTADLKRRYVLNLTMRRDGSSRFGEGKQIGNFGSVAGVWIFSEENAVKKNFDWLSFGKLRVSYGLTGNDQITPYQYLSTYGSSPYTYLGTTGLRPSRIANDDFRWETTKKTELSLELGFINNKILLNTNFYLNRSDDQLVNYRIPQSTGFATYQANLPAVVQNSGLEFELTTNNIRRSNLSWQTNVNLTLPRNKLISFENFSASSYANTLALGYDITRIYGYTSIGINSQTGRADYLDASGVTSLTPYFFNTIGKQTPDFYGGLGNSISYKGFSLDIFIDFAKQMKVGGIVSSAGRMLNNYSIFNNRWRAAGDVTTLPKASTVVDNLISGSNLNFYDASFLRLKNINLSYDLSKSILKSLGLDRLRIYAQAQNLYTLWNRNNPFMDPESGAFSATNQTFPPMKTLLIGLQAQF